MKYNPHDYQSYATDFILKHPIAAILLQMGLGKSVITLTAMQELFSRGEIRKALVIAPLRVARDTWPEEIRKWDHLKGLNIFIPDELSMRFCTVLGLYNRGRGWYNDPV